MTGTPLSAVHCPALLTLLVYRALWVTITAPVCTYLQCVNWLLAVDVDVDVDVRACVCSGAEPCCEPSSQAPQTAS